MYRCAICDCKLSEEDDVAWCRECDEPACPECMPYDICEFCEELLEDEEL